MARSIKFLSKAERERPSDDQVKASSSFSSQRPNHKRKERQEAMASRLANLEREKELEAIKEQYLSQKPKKRVIIKPSEKFRFSFDWDNSEDTSRDINKLYQDPHEAKLLFGRGFRGGVDRREQKKKNKLEDLHWREKKFEAMTERDWRIFQEDSDITYEYYKGGGCSNKLKKIPHPMRCWAESNLCSKLLMALERNGYKKPSPIQMAAIPLGLQQQDAIGIAQTGSGKTAAFVIPMLSYISSRRPSHKDSEDEGPYALILVPTRELALQIEKETLKLAHYLDIKIISVVGGHSIEEQGFKVSQGCDVLVATPWRLIDLLERRYVVLNNCNYVVLDEADQMVNMGFEPQVLAVLDAIPSSNLKPEHDLDDENMIYRTTYMFSATMSPAVEKLARKYLRNPVVVRVGTVGKASGLVTQNVVMTTESEKLGKLKRLLDEQGDHKTAIVFVNTRRNVDTVAKNLDDAGYCVTTLHGGKTQEQRELSLEGFRSKRHNVLVATDVAGRGIDVPDVAHVINFDMPRDIEKYTHRIGRTGRAGKRGTSTTFLTKEDRDIFYELKRTLS